MATLAHCPKCAQGHTLPQDPDRITNAWIKCLGCAFEFEVPAARAALRAPSTDFTDGPRTEPLDRPYELFGGPPEALEAQVSVHIDEDPTQLQPESNEFGVFASEPLHPEFDPTVRVPTQRPRRLSMQPPPIPISEVPEASVQPAGTGRRPTTRSERVQPPPTPAPTVPRHPSCQAPPPPSGSAEGSAPSVYDRVEAGSYEDKPARALSVSEVVWRPPPVPQALIVFQSLPLAMKAALVAVPLALGASLILLSPPKPIPPVHVGVVDLPQPPPKKRMSSSSGVMLRDALVHIRPHADSEAESELALGTKVRVYDVRNGYLLVVGSAAQVAGFVEASAVRLKPVGESVSTAVKPR